jgi:pimeloyl-ACP methyl ester carboxylesterase
MAAFDEQHYEINGVDTVVLSAGSGDPLVFMHGAGTATGFDALLPLAEGRRLIVPIHPGFGASADDPSIDSVHDYRRHYLDVFDVLGLGEFDLAGHSMGGYIASTIAIDSGDRVRSLVLAAPLGLRVPEHPTLDLFTIPGAELPLYLTEDLSIFAGKVPNPPTPEFLAAGYREMTSAARILWERNYDKKHPRWLHRLTMPTLLLWGDADRLIPVEQAAVWAEYIPDAKVKTLPGLGHLLFDESAEAVDAVASFVSSTAAPAT